MTTEWRFVDTDEIDFKLNDLKSIAEKNNISFESVMKLYEILEYRRRTDIMVINAEEKNDHLDSIAEIGKDLISKIIDLPAKNKPQVKAVKKKVHPGLQKYYEKKIDESNS